MTEKLTLKTVLQGDLFSNINKSVNSNWPMWKKH